LPVTTVFNEPEEKIKYCMHEIITYKGWPNCIRLYNDEIELIATTDIGPRVMSSMYRRRIRVKPGAVNGGYMAGTAYGLRRKNCPAVTILIMIR
jgi:hypothetical protein